MSGILLGTILAVLIMPNVVMAATEEPVIKIGKPAPLKPQVADRKARTAVPVINTPAAPSRLYIGITIHNGVNMAGQRDFVSQTLIGYRPTYLDGKIAYEAGLILPTKNGQENYTPAGEISAIYSHPLNANVSATARLGAVGDGKNGSPFVGLGLTSKLTKNLSARFEGRKGSMLRTYEALAGITYNF